MTKIPFPFIFPFNFYFKSLTSSQGATPSAGARSLFAFLSTALLAVTATAQIASGTTGIDATGNTASEIAACNSGSSQQSRDTCLTEARKASGAKRAGQLNNTPGTYDANAAQRCEALQGDDKLACQARMSGGGTTQGGVAGGGIVREIETVLPAETPTGVK